MTAPLSPRMVKRLDKLNTDAQAHGLEVRHKAEKGGWRYAVGSDARGVVFCTSSFRNLEYYVKCLGTSCKPL